MLQAMYPVKFSVNRSDFPTFRTGLRDKLEVEVLNDNQKLEFLPKFATGEVYALNERVAGWSCEAILDIVLERYGDPAAFAAAFIRYLHMTHNPLRFGGVTSRRNVWYHDKN